MRNTLSETGRLKRYGVALACVATAFLIIYATWPFLKPTTWAPFLIAVLVSAWFGGYGPSFFAVVASAIVGQYFLFEPYGGSNPGKDSVFRTLVFLVLSTFVAFLISAKRRAEQLERAERKRFQATVTSIGDAVIATDARGRISFMNGVAEKLTAWSAAEAEGRPLEEIFVIVNETTREMVESPVQKVLETGQTQGLANHTILIARDGKEWHIDDSAAPIKDDGLLLGVVLVFHDITDRKRTEEAVTQSEERLRALATASSDVMYVMTSDWSEMLPIDGRSLVASNDVPLRNWMRQNLPPSEHDLIQEEIRQAIAAKRMFELEHRIYRPDGSIAWTHSRAVPMLDANGDILDWFGMARDVTHRKQAEEEKERVEAEAERQRRIYEAALSNTPDLVYIFDLNHRFTYANEALLKMWGQSREDALGKNCLELGYEPWHAEMHDREIDHVIATRQSIRGEVPFIGTNGRRVYDYIFAPILDSDGVVVAVAGTTRDVTDRKKSEEDNLLRTAQYETLLNAAPIGVYLVDAKFCVRGANPTARLVFGDIPDLIGRDFDEVIHILWPDIYADELVERFRHTLETGETFSLSEKIEQRRDRGVRECYEWHISRIPFPDGDNGVVCYFRDISSEVKAREVIAESEARFRMIAENVRQLFWGCRPDGQCDYLSNQWVEYTGIPELEQLGLRWLDLVIHPDDKESTLKTWMDAVNDVAPYDLEYRIKGADGIYRWFKTRGTPIRDASGTIVKWFGTCTDIDAQVRAEESLREADRRKDEFLAMLAHELRNPLAAVSNAATILKFSSDPDNLNFAKDIIDRQSKQLARLIEDLLDVSRITSGKIRLKRELCDAGTILKNAVESIRPLVEERKHRLEIDIVEGSLPLRADPVRVEQIMVNLLTNAAKYTESGGRIRLAAELSDGQVVISVEDNGTGIPPEKLPQMFELFAQGERSIARSEGGLGIGLTIVQKLAEMHGGSVSATSEGTGKGSTFTVRLPATSRTASAQKSSGIVAPTEKRGSRILVVDDNMDTARGLARLLKLLGNDVQVAHDGTSAIDAARILKPDFVLLDIGLPGMDGYQVAQKLREEPSCTSAVIIAISGYGQDEDRRRSREAGFDHHLVKPVDFDALTSLLSQAI